MGVGQALSLRTGCEPVRTRVEVRGQSGGNEKPATGRGFAGGLRLTRAAGAHPVRTQTHGLSLSKCRAVAPRIDPSPGRTHTSRGLLRTPTASLMKNATQTRRNVAGDVLLCDALEIPAILHVMSHHSTVFLMPSIAGLDATRCPCAASAGFRFRCAATTLSAFFQCRQAVVRSQPIRRQMSLQS